MFPPSFPHHGFAPESLGGGDELELTNVSSRLVNIAVGVVMVLGGISQFFPASMSSIIVGAYVIVFGLGKFLPPHEILLMTLLTPISSCCRSGVPPQRSRLRLPLRLIPLLFPGPWYL
jgi:hypothetical protein